MKGHLPTSIVTPCPAFVSTELLQCRWGKCKRSLPICLVFSSVSLVGLINTGSLGDMLRWFGRASERRGAVCECLGGPCPHLPLLSSSRTTSQPALPILTQLAQLVFFPLVSKVHCLDPLEIHLAQSTTLRTSSLAGLSPLELVVRSQAHQLMFGKPS